MTAPENLRSKLLQRLPLVLVSFTCIFSMYLQSRPCRLQSAVTAFSVASDSRITVSVRGDVRNPGIYMISDNILTGGAIQMASPFIPYKSLFPSGIEAAPLVQGSEITILSTSNGEGLVQVRPLPVAQKILLSVPLDINKMAIQDFIGLPGIGPALARRIAIYRQNNGGFMQVQDLLAVEGIGEKKYAQLKKYF